MMQKKIKGVTKREKANLPSRLLQIQSLISDNLDEIL